MLRSCIKAQMKIISQQKGCIFSFYFLLLFVLFNYISNVLHYRGTDVLDMIQPIKLTLLSESNGGFSYYLMQLYPLLVVFPSGFSYIRDRDSNEVLFQSSRVGTSNYFIAKAFSSFLITFLVFSVPLLIEICLNALAFPLNAMGDISNVSAYELSYIQQVKQYFWPDLYVSSPWLYTMFFIIVWGIFSGILGLFTVAISMFGLKYKILLFLPSYILLYGISMVKQLFPEMPFETNYFFYLRLFSTASKSMLAYVLFMAVLAVISIIIIFRKARQDWLQ